MPLDDQNRNSKTSMQNHVQEPKHKSQNPQNYAQLMEKSFIQEKNYLLTAQSKNVYEFEWNLLLRTKIENLNLKIVRFPLLLERVGWKYLKATRLRIWFLINTYCVSKRVAQVKNYFRLFVAILQIRLISFLI